MRNFILIFILALIHGCGCTGLAQTVGKQLEFNSCWGTDCTSNLVKNPSAAKNDLFKTTSNATATRDTSSGNKVDGIASWLVDTSALAGYVEFELIPTPDDVTSGNCMAKLVYKGDGSLYSLQILDGSNNVLNSALLQNVGSNWSVPAVANAACAASAARKVRITQTVAGTSPAINVGKVFYGKATNIGAGVPNNVFSAKVSSGGAISNENEPGWLASCTSTSCTWRTNQFAVAPNCVATTNSGATTVQVTSTSTTSVTWLTYNSGWSTVAQPLTLVCTRAGSDFIQPTITPNQWNYGRRLYTPVFQGFGTPTNIECYESRENEYLNIDCKFTTGTTTAVEARVGLPGSLLSATLTQGIRMANNGTTVNTSSTSTGRVFPLIESGVNYITFGNQDGGSGFTKINGTTYFGSSQAISFSARIPIQGWTANQNAPQLLGSVTSDSNNAIRNEFLVFGGASATLATTLACTSSPCTAVLSSGPWFSTVTRSGAGQYAVNTTSFPNGAMCTCSSSVKGAGYNVCSIINKSSTAINILVGQGGVNQDDMVWLDCKGPR